MADEAVTPRCNWRTEFEEWKTGRVHVRGDDGEWRPLPKSEAPDIINRGMGWCGCGNPEDIDQMFLWELRYQNASDRYEIDKTSWTWRHENHKTKMGGSNARLLVCYLLDWIGATDHGGSVTGAWLTDEGKELLEALSECYPDDDYLKGL